MSERSNTLLAVKPNDAIAEKYDAVVGIDLGTSRSGFSYAFTSDGDVRNYTGWLGGPGMSTKTPSECVYDNAGGLYFGWGAKRQFATLFKTHKLGVPRLIRHAKLLLLNDDPTIPGAGSLSALTVMSDLLREIKNKALHFISTAQLPMPAHRILWVVTIPAGWGDREKNRYRDIAQKAGLITSVDSDQERLILLPEPEAAMVYCQRKVQHELDHLKAVGRRFMVVDAGGGTVDVSSYEIVDGDKLSQLSASQADTCGSEFVSRALEEHFIAIFQSTVARLLNDPGLTHIWYEQLDKLEMFKCGYSPRNDGTLYLGYEAIFYKEAYKDDAASHELQRLGERQGGDDARIHFTHEQLVNFFQPVCAQAAAVARVVAGRSLETAGGKLDAIVLVGGFSESTLFQDSMRAALREFVHSKEVIIVPPAPADAVVSGATAYGLNPEIIHSRRSRLTYGAGCAMPFEEGRDAGRTRVLQDGTGQPFCTDRFDPFVLANQAVPVGEAVVKTYGPPLKASQESAFMKLYSTLRTDVRYVDEPGVYRYPGEIVLPLPSDGRDRSITVSMYFGRTEVELVVHSTATNEQKTIRGRFSGGYGS